jgi:hypothetical protein
MPSPKLTNFDLALTQFLINSGWDPFDPDAEIDGGDLVECIMWQIEYVRKRHLSSLDFSAAYQAPSPLKKGNK